jgi:prepilin-type N-terminal cleavage/methylation domain-containing protein
VRVDRIRVGGGGYHPTRVAERGFTLVELMTVVVITGVLATVCFESMRRHARAAGSLEAVAMLQSIRGAEERWRAEHMMYLDVSRNNAWYPRDPTAIANKNTEGSFFFAPGDVTHGDNNGWLALRPAVAGPVRYGYLVNAGNPGDVMTAPAFGPAVAWPTPTENWYVIQAIGDMDNDGDYSYYRASSLDGEVDSINPGG